MKDLKTILESKPRVKDYDCQPYGYINALQNYIDKLEKAINYNQCCTELNPEFEIGEQVLLTKRTVVTIETFCEDGMIEIDDDNEYYKVDKDELSRRV